MPFDPARLESYSVLPGVYLMKNSAGEVLYIGKAKNLRARLKQYFLAAGDGRPMIPFLIPKVETIETILVHSEKEALLLENNLIKEHQPIYNALLKDDKTYIALKVTSKNSWPTVQLVRYRGRPEPDGLYFGPYTSAFSARNTLDLIQRIFPLRQCSDQEFARRTRPCILYDMKRCIAPCVNKCTKEEYLKLVERVVKFLRGHDKEIVKELYEEMYQAAEALAFEKAAALLASIRHIEKTIEEQQVDKPFGTDLDAWGLFRQGCEVILSQLLFREGKLMGARHYNFSEIAEDDQELFESFLLQHYQRQEQLPKEILLPVALPEGLAEILNISLSTPLRGQKYALIQMAQLNAEDMFKKEKDAAALREKRLLEMQEKFKLTRYPQRIECFDNSNLSGTEPVSVMVAFTDGLKDKKRYRKYKIKTVEGQDDYSTLMEVLKRRYKRAQEESDLPDLLLIDGGKGHLNVALKALHELNLITIDVIAVAKEEALHTRGMTQEQVYLPNLKDPILLKPTSSILFLLQQIRDEAHRFALTFHRARRSKQTLRTALEEIPGIGPTKSRRLLRHFGSLKKVLAASSEELKQVKGLSVKDVEAIKIFKVE